MKKWGGTTPRRCPENRRRHPRCDLNVKENELPFQSGSGERAESLGVRRSLELPAADIEAAGELAPASGSVSVEKSAPPAPAGEEAEDSRERSADTVPSAKEEQEPAPAQVAAAARDVLAVTPPDRGAGAGDGTPPDRPKKPVLAAVAIGGAVLLAIPILLIGTGSHDGKKHRTSSADDRVLSGDGPPPGAFVSASPTVTPTPSASASPKVKSKSAKQDAGKHAAKVAAAGSSTGQKLTTKTNVLIKNVMTGLCVDVPENTGAPQKAIQQYTCRGSNDNMLWDLVVNKKGTGPNGADLFSIRNSLDNYCADLPGTGAVSSGTHVTENRCSPGLGGNQEWYLDKKAAHSYWIRNYVSGKDCLNVLGTDGSGGKDAALTVVACDPQDDHRWSFS
jgi:hypothetical protein